MKQRFQNVAPAPLWKDSPSYPGAPELPATVRQSTAKVTYTEFVTDYASTMARRGATFAAGMLLAVGGGINIDNTALLLFVVGAGVVLATYGVVGLVATHQAHEDWYRHGIGVSTTLMQPERTEVQPVTARPFVASENGKRTRTGRLQFAPAVWQSLFDMALQNGGTVTKDIARGAGVGRQWYHTDYATTPDGFRPFLNELRQLGFIDAQNGLTAAALEWYAAQFPALPLAAAGLRPGTVRPTRGSDATDPAEDGAGGYE